MACMKCGRNTEETQYFCDSCQKVMQRYPVKPNTAIQLPKRPVTQEQPKRRRRSLFPEETIEHLRSAVRWEAAVIVVLLIALILVSGMLAWEWLKPDETLDYGRNYTVTEDPVPTVTEAPATVATEEPTYTVTEEPFPTASEEAT